MLKNCKKYRDVEIGSNAKEVGNPKLVRSYQLLEEIIEAGRETHIFWKLHAEGGDNEDGRDNGS